MSHSPQRWAAPRLRGRRRHNATPLDMPASSHREGRHVSEPDQDRRSDPGVGDAMPSVRTRSADRTNPCDVHDCSDSKKGSAPKVPGSLTWWPPVLSLAPQGAPQAEVGDPCHLPRPENSPAEPDQRLLVSEGRQGGGKEISPLEGCKVRSRPVAYLIATGLSETRMA